MKFIHCADLHLDSKMTAWLKGEQARERRNEILLTFRRMVEYAAANDVQGIIIAGDLYDKKNISATARNTIISMIREHPDICFFYLRGNHDADTLLHGFDELPVNLYLFSDDSWTSYSVEDSGITITGTELPAEHTGAVLEELELDGEDCNIVVLHGQLENGSGQKSRSAGGSVHIGLRSLQNKGIDYLALGHIHARDAGKLDGRGIWCYPGCLEGRGFDECGDHGFILLDVEPLTRKIDVSFVPAACRRLFEVQVNITECRDSYEVLLAIEEELKAGACEGRDLLKILLTGEKEPDFEISPDYLEKQLEDYCYYLKVVDRTRIHVDYREYEQDISLKGEFVRRVQKDPELSEEEKAEVIRYGIRLLLGEMTYED